MKLTPLWIGFLRGLAIASAVSALEGAVMYFGDADIPGVLLPWTPIILLGLRTIEGWMDGRKQ